MIEGKNHRKWQHMQMRLGLWWNRAKNDGRIIVGNRSALFGLLLLMFFFLVGVSYPLLRKTVMRHAIYNPQVAYDPLAEELPRYTARHPLGVCCEGRDTLSLLMAATQPTFVVGVSAALATAITATVIGLGTAYYRGNTALILGLISKSFLIIPPPLVMIVVGTRFRDLGPAHLGIIYGLIAGMGGGAIVIRSQGLKVMAMPFISAARASGAGGRHIIMKHLLPHMLPLIITYMTLAVRDAVIADSFLSWFGFTRSYLNWGYMIFSDRYSLTVMLPAVIAISLFSASFYLVSQGFQELAASHSRRG